MFACAEFILRWFIYCLTGMIGPFVPTTKELQKPWELLLKKFFLSPLYLMGAVLLFMPAYIAFTCRYLLHKFRNPYHLSIALEERPWLIDRRKGKTSKNARRYNGAIESEAETYSFSTMNVCLLPELAAKVNNFDQTKQRAKTAGERIIIDQFFFTNVWESQQHLQNGYIKHSINRSFKPSLKSGQDFGVVSHFPHLDFLCIQETFDRDCAKLLLQELHKVFPWVVYDVGTCGIKANYCGIVSGLMVASRYEIIEVDFKRFPYKTGLDHLTDKGLLMVKVSLDGGAKTPSGKVGYIFNTHLQAFQGDKPVVQKQLDCLLEWTTKFRQDTSEHSETVMFDVICGDFNIDNLSPGEIPLGKHEIFSVYTDFGRVQVGKDKDWVVGTELRIPTLQDDAISTPESLKKVLEDPYLLQQYLIDADIESATMSGLVNAMPKTDKYGNIVLSPVGGKRRIDWILYRNDCSLEVKKYQFVTQLASLTDHIPVSMTINCKAK